MLNHQHVYSTLRSALVDRDRDPSFILDTAMTVNIGQDSFALRQAVPSGALLIAYTMLFRPGFLETADRSDQWWGNGHYWLGGDSNPYFPVFANDVVASIAIAVGVYAGLLKTVSLNNGVHLRPNFDTPMVRRTWEIMQQSEATIGDAKNLFVDMMQDDEYRLTVPVADDFIANAFIAEFDIAVDSLHDQIQRQGEAARDLD